MIPRNEYPRPQLVRKEWLCLNGRWDFEFDDDKAGEKEHFFERASLDSQITVPFCPESALSGIGDTDFHECVWYRRDIEVPRSWQGKRIIIHFGACDWLTVLYVNGVRVGEHRGGNSSFSFDITDYLADTDNSISVCVYDNLRGGHQPGGKQCHALLSEGCCYTRTTGIWQTVWLEPVSKRRISGVNYVSDINAPAVTVTAKLCGHCAGCSLTADVFYDGKNVGSAKTRIDSFDGNLYIPLSEKHLWDIGKGELYSVVLTLRDGNKILDRAESYFGLRTVGLTDNAFLLNGRKVFGRWVLDQGYYPDGIWTAPSDDKLRNDILYSQSFGFNGARLHQKVFEPRFLYWADMLGYPVWGEYPSWGCDMTHDGDLVYVLPEWEEVVERDIAHPSVIGWCPINETLPERSYFLVETLYKYTKAADPTRPCIDTSGYYHTSTDIYDVHDYEQDAEIFLKNHENADYYRGPAYQRGHKKGEPYFISEYGGISWYTGMKDGWSYGGAENEQDFFDRYRALTDTMLQNPKIMGFCYTQLYDIEQEQNGFMTYDRQYKFDPARIREINEQSADVEK